ncbi:MAG TPA: glutamine-synthetase adenylyltransferase, partial [Tahibacter sp.]|nr:glutamine-synthetase adenylyltransferase [Tahibacter sp.]
MTTAAVSFSDFLESRYAHLLARCREAGVPFYDDAGVAERLQRVLLASDFAYDCFSRDPALLAPEALMLMSDPRPADARIWQLDPGERDEARQMALLRRFRKREALRLIWRDVNGFDEVIDTLDGSTALAETCIEAALRYAEANLSPRHGRPRDAQGRAQRLVVLGLGKLGGG